MSDSQPGARPLVVLLHAYNSSPEALGAVAAVVERSFGRDASILRPELGIGAFSVENPNSIAAKIVDLISAAWNKAKAEQQPYTSVVLAGHSFGALLARKIYVIACGEHPCALFEPEIGERGACEWAPSVDRIILLAGMNRGWRITHHLGLLRGTVGTLAVSAARLWCRLTGRRFAIFHIERGSVFLTQLRLQWLWMRRRAAAEPGQPGGALTIQLLGTIDDLVSPEDNVDLVSGGDFLYLDVPVSSHANVIEMDDPGEGLAGRTSGQLRSEVFALSLTGTADELRASAIIPDDLANVIHPARGVTEIVFVIHGIRDRGYWTHRIAREVRREAVRVGRKFETETSSYGYFPMLPFLASFKRREKVQWLMDQYAEAVALYPDAEKFHFVGHSNGTYCLATALEDYPCCRFDNVVFAGSVVRRSFDWSRFRPEANPDAGRRHGVAAKVLNFVATRDIVVAIFPNLFEYLWRSQRLGSAGHRGFTSTDSGVHEVRYVEGGHSAALNEANWKAIARFILDGSPPEVPAQLERDRQKRYAVLAGTLLGTLAIWLLLVAIFLGGIPLGILSMTASQPQWLATLALVAYAFLLLKVLTRL